MALYGRTVRSLALASSAAIVLAQSGCGGGSDPPPPDTAVVELPPAGTSRVALREYDADLDGVIDQTIRYVYDGHGWLVRMDYYLPVGGVPAMEPVQTISREHDEHGRVLRIRLQSATYTQVLEATYGLDGRVASTTLTRTGSEPLVTRYTWDGARMTGYVVDGRSPADSTLSYGADGRVAAVTQVRAQGTDVWRYAWREDGQLASASSSEAVGRLVLYQLLYDVQGHLLEVQKTDDGFGDGWRRFGYDVRGRQVLVEIGQPPDYFDNGVEFVLQSRWRTVWEDLPCQPVYEPAALPLTDLEMTGGASAIGATLGCSSQP